MFNGGIGKRNKGGGSHTEHWWRVQEQVCKLQNRKLADFCNLNAFGNIPWKSGNEGGRTSGRKLEPLVRPLVRQQQQQHAAGSRKAAAGARLQQR